MRRRWGTLGTLCLVASLCVVAGLGPTQPVAEAQATGFGADGIVELPIPENGQGWITVDPSTGTIVVTGGDSIYFLDPDGVLLSTLDGLDRPRSAVIVGTTMYMTSGAGLLVVDLTSRTVDRTIPIGFVSDFYGIVGFAGGWIWIDDGEGSLTRVDPTTDAVTVVVSAPFASSWRFDPSGTSDYIVEYDSIAGPPRLRVHDVSTGALVEVASRQASTEFYDGYHVHWGGDRLTVRSEDAVWTIPALTDDPTWAGEDAPIATGPLGDVAIIRPSTQLIAVDDGDGSVLASGDSLNLNRNAMSADERSLYMFLPPDNDLQRLSFEPVVTEYAPKVILRDVADDLLIGGDRFDSITAVTINGVSTPFSALSDGRLRLTVPVVANDTLTVGITSPMGTSTFDIEARIEPGPDESIIVQHIVQYGTTNRSPEHFIQCDDQFFDQPAQSIGRDGLTALLVPRGAECRAFLGGSWRSISSGEANNLAGDGLFDPFRGSVEVTADKPVHFVRHTVSFGQPRHVIWVDMSAGFGARPGTRYGIRVECGGDRQNRRLVAGERARFEVASTTCAITAYDDAGAQTVWFVPFNFEDPTDFENGSIGRYDTRNADFSDQVLQIFADFGAPDWAAPIIVRSPGEDRGARRPDAGTVTVIPTDRLGNPSPEASILLMQGRGVLTGGGEAGDRFGHAVAQGDINGDGWRDIVIGAPGEGLRGKSGAGMAHVVFMGPTGPISSIPIHLDVAQVPGAPKRGDRLGTAVGIADWDQDGRQDILLGAPGRDIDGKRNAGGILVIPGGVGGPDFSRSFWLTENTPGVGGKSEAGDRFGSVIAARGGAIVVGVPDENIGSKKDAGLVHHFSRSIAGNEHELIRQGRNRIEGGAQAGDRFGAAVATDGLVIAIGVPGEDVGNAVDAGVVVIRERRTRAGDTATFGTFDVTPSVRAGDRVGTSVAITRSSGDTSVVLAGAPGRTSRNQSDAGAILSLGYDRTRNRIATVGSIDQEGDGFPDKSERNDRLGSEVAFDLRGNLVVSIPGEAVGGRPGAGTVTVLGVDITRISESTRGIKGKAEAGDNWGSANT